MKFVKRLLWSVVLIVAVIWGFQNRSTLVPEVRAAAGYTQSKLAAALSGQLGSKLMGTEADDATTSSSSTTTRQATPKASQTQTTQSTTSGSTTTVTATPIESIVEDVNLSKTYYYYFDSDLPSAGRQVFKDAIAQYNATGLVHLVAGTAAKGDNSIEFSLYHKKMPKGETSIELGQGGPKIYSRVNWQGTSSHNQARASLNGDYTMAFSDAVAVHELGHALGLDHSTDLKSVMYPVSQGQSQLTASDLAGLKSIYQN